MNFFEHQQRARRNTGGVLRAKEELTPQAVEAALRGLKSLAPLKKPALIKACLAAATTDDRLSVAEGELLRAICAALDTPLPPILETMEAAA